MFGDFMRRLLPSSKKQVADRFDELGRRLEAFRNATDGKVSALCDEMRLLLNDMDTRLMKLKEENESNTKKIECILKEYGNRLSDIGKKAGEAEGFSRENNWGMIFNNAIAGSDWLKKTNFSFGRWAIGYQCAYILFRILNEVKPKKILELGLGQSTKLISQYVEKNADVVHQVFESNPDWIDFFRLNYSIPKNTQIVQSDCVFMDYEGIEHIRGFDGFDEKIRGKKFDLVVIDAPLGGDMPELSRIDVLRNLPECLDESFVILIYDVGRSGEKNTFERMKRKLAVGGGGKHFGLSRQKKRWRDNFGRFEICLHDVRCGNRRKKCLEIL